jgi:hypothetical protein
MSGAGRRLLGIGLLVWGTVGLLIVIAGLTAGLDAASRTEALIASSDRALNAASASAQRTADALDGVAVGIGQAQSSTVRAATLAHDASATLDSMADSMSITILGTQPFQPLASDFADSAQNAAALADELEALAGSLETTGADTDLLADELRLLGDALADATDGTGSVPPLRLALLVVLVWVAIPTLGAFVIGLALVRGGPRDAATG